MGGLEELPEICERPEEVVRSAGDRYIFVVIAVGLVGFIVTKVPTVDMRIGCDGGYAMIILTEPAMFVEVTVAENFPAGVGTENECEVGDWRGKKISTLGKSDVIL